MEARKTDITTIKLYDETKKQLDLFRENKNESYDDVIKKVMFIARNCKTHPQLSRETLESIDKARDRIRKGNFVSEEEARKRLGI